MTRGGLATELTLRLESRGGDPGAFPWAAPLDPPSTAPPICDCVTWENNKLSLGLSLPIQGRKGLDKTSGSQTASCRGATGESKGEGQGIGLWAPALLFFFSFNLTIFKCTNQWHQVGLQCCPTITTVSRTFHRPKQKLILIKL